jgi:hypothetical protein
MKKKSRRFEVLLPARFNDGREVPDELLGKAVDEVIEQFHAVTFYKEGRKGFGSTTRSNSVITSGFLWSIFRTPTRTADG